MIRKAFALIPLLSLLLLTAGTPFLSDLRAWCRSLALSSVQTALLIMILLLDLKK